jgi:hypothetical protein
MDAATSDLVADKLANLYGLVFELRQGVEDLQFRLQLSNEKATLFLQILSSLHEAFLSTPTAATSEKAPDTEHEAKEHTQGSTHSGEVMMQSEEQHGKERKHRELEIKPEMQDPVRNCPSCEATMQDIVHWGDGTPIIEEEPGPEDLQGTWPGMERRHSEIEINHPSIAVTAQVEVNWEGGTPIIEEEPGHEDLQGTWPDYVATI